MIPLSRAENATFSPVNKVDEVLKLALEYELIKAPLTDDQKKGLIDVPAPTPVRRGDVVRVPRTTRPRQFVSPAFSARSWSPSAPSAQQSLASAQTLSLHVFLTSAILSGGSVTYLTPSFLSSASSFS